MTIHLTLAVKLTRSSPAVISEYLALLTQRLRVLLGLVGYIQAVRFVKRSLLVRVDVDVALDAHLPHVGPTVATHPLAFARRTLVLSETSLFALVGSEAFAFRSCLQNSIFVRIKLVFLTLQHEIEALFNEAQQLE